jgi:tRNA 2-thiouridine synthesizing protein A
LVLGCLLEAEVLVKISGILLLASPFFRRKKGASSVHEADLELDITAEVCPMTFVRAKLALEQLIIGDILRIRLRDGEPRHNVPRAMRDHGHEIISLTRLDREVFELRVRKCR